MVSVEGLDELNRIAFDLGRAGLRAAGEAAKAVQKTAHDIAGTAQALAPVDTGALRSSIGVDSSASGLTAVIGPTVSYGPFLEYGTSRMAPRAFMGPAADRHGHQLGDALAEIADRTL